MTSRLTMSFHPVEPINLSQPTISGAVIQEGEPLTISKGTWRKSRLAVSFVATVYRDTNVEVVSIPFTGDTVTYTPIAADVGARLDAVVAATNLAGTTTARSDLTSIVAAAAPVLPVNTTPPSVLVPPKVGEAVSYSVGTWENLPAANFNVDIRVNGVGKGANYTPVTADIGHTVVVSVVAFNDAGSSAPALSTASAPIAAPDVLLPEYDFGDSVRAGAGGFPVPAGSTAFSGTASGVVISGGFVVPTGDGSVVPGTVIFNNGGGTVNVLASTDALAVRLGDGGTELKAALAWLNTFDAAGYTILLRSETYVAPLYFTGKYTSQGAEIYDDQALSITNTGALWTGFVTIRSAVPTSPIVMRGGTPAAWIQKIRLSGCKWFKFTDVRMNRPKGQINTSGFSGATNEGVAFFNSQHIWVEECAIIGDPLSADNNTTGMTYSYCSDITVRRNRFDGTFNGMGAGNTGVVQQNIDINHNWFPNWSSNNLQLYGGFDGVKFNFNNHGAPYKPVTSSTTHVDCHQHGTRNDNSDSYKNFEIIGNRFDKRLGTADAQFIFHREMPNIPTSLDPEGHDTPYDGHLENFDVYANFAYMGQNVGITLGWGDRIRVGNNATLLPPGEVNQTAPTMSFATAKNRQYTDANGDTRTFVGIPWPVTNGMWLGNLANGYRYDNEQVEFWSLRNFNVSAGSAVEMGALFEDPTRAELLAALEPLAGGPLDTVAGNPRAYVAGPYCPYITHAVWDGDGLVSEGSHDFPSMEAGYPSPTLTALTDQPLNTTVVSPYQTISGTSATGVLIVALTQGFSIRLVSASDVLIASGVDHVVAYNGEKWRLEMTTPSFGGDTYVCDYVVGHANKKQWSVGVTAGGSYVQKLVRADGADWFTRMLTADLKAGAKGMFAASLNFLSGSNAATSYLFSIGGKFSCYKNTSNKIYIGLRDAGSTVRAIWTSADAYTSASGLVHIAASWDFSTAGAIRFQVFINGIDVTTKTGSTLNLNATPGNVKYDNGIMSAIFATGSGASQMRADVSDLYINVVDSLDLTSNIGLFFSGGAPVDLGTIGDGPTGQRPLVFAGRTMDAAAWNTGNWLGTSVGWTPNGALADVI